MFVFWWRGRGGTVLLMIICSAALGMIAQAAAQRSGDPPYGAIFGLMAAALPVHLYVKKLQANAGFKYDAKRGGVFLRRLGDSLFSINLRFWPLLCIGLGILLLVITVVSGRLPA